MRLTVCDYVQITVLYHGKASWLSAVINVPRLLIVIVDLSVSFDVF